ncbi:anti-sigma-D factor RsdA [Micromonospora sp. B11E3]|uniref:anti-sigma-D factor RsdA n=1 Tax=Micromonospora sp. B11E3 TaxID=3153562 RepID=UPI00325CDB8C
MTEHGSDGGGQPELATVARDDLLLDALGRGEEPTDGDALAAMLAAWRADLLADGADLPDADLFEPAADGAGLPHEDMFGPGADATPASGGGPTVAGGRRRASRPARSRRPGRWGVRLAAAAAAALVLAAGLGAASRQSGPSSPLWSLTKVLYPEQAEVRAVEHTIGRAREALAAGRLDAARELVGRARRDLARVTDPAVAARLRAELDSVLRDLDAAAPAQPSPAGPAPVPAAPTTGGPGGASHEASPGATAPLPRPSATPAPAPSATSGPSPLPLLPGLLPTSPLLPSLPGLPGLPLPSGGLLD